MTEGDGKRGEELLRRLVAAHEPAPQLLCVFAHPDDETLALGGRLERLGSSRLVTVTDGVPRDGADAAQHGFTSLAAYGVERRAELLRALATAGLGREFATVFAGRVSDQTAALHLPELATAIAAEIVAFRPEAVMTHPYEGGHPDHDACAFAVREAVRRLSFGEPARVIPVILEAPFYHAGPHGEMVTGSFPEARVECPAVTVALTEEQQERKAERLACFHSQGETLRQFATTQEQYRLAPPYDFRQRPHPGQLLYERFPWGMQGDQFCELAQDAMQQAGGLRGSSLPPAHDEHGGAPLS